MNATGCLTHIDLTLDGEVLGPVHAEHVHAVLCTWMDRDQHSAQRKPFTLRRLSVASARVDLGVSTLSESALIDLQSALINQPIVRLGRSSFQISSALMTRNAGWDDLLFEASPASRIDVNLDSPTVFRSGAAMSVMPTAGLVFGHLRAVWQQWAPDALQPDIDLSSVLIHVDKLTGRTEDVVARGRTWRGFVGTVGFDLSAASPRDSQVLSALAALAPFAGIGANTTIGMGATSVDVGPRKPKSASAPRRARAVSGGTR